MLCGMHHPYIGGEYIFTLKIPHGYPEELPELTFLTPNGVFQTGIKSNIFVKNHTDIYAYARDVISFMIDPDEARIKCESEEEQDLLARLESIILKHSN